MKHAGERVYFRPAGLDGPHDGCDVEGTHFHDGEFRDFWSGLTLTQKRDVEDHARTFCMSLSAVAIRIGAQSSNGG